MTSSSSTQSQSILKLDESEKKVVDAMLCQSAKDLIHCSTDIQKQGFEILRKHFSIAKSIKLAKSNLICFKLDWCAEKKRKIASLVHPPPKDSVYLKECLICKDSPEVNSHKVIVDLMNQLTEIQKEYNAFVLSHKV